MKTTLETITPTQATKWLEPGVNRDNRGLRPSQVEYLSKQIIANKWQVTHQGIAFAKDGRLLDGQHRLAAIVRSGIAVQIQVSRDCEPEAFQVVDCGLKRVHFDRLHLVDDPGINKTLCTTINYFLRATEYRSQAVPVSAIEDAFLGKDGKMADSWLWMSGLWAAPLKGLKFSSVMASVAVYHYIDHDKAETFNDGYMSGAGLEPGDPALALRDCIFRRASRVDYWVAQNAMRQHLQGRTLKSQLNGTHLYAATVDMLGNSNSSELIRKRMEAAKKGVVTLGKEGMEIRNAKIRETVSAISEATPAAVRAARSKKGAETRRRKKEESHV